MLFRVLDVNDYWPACERWLRKASRDRIEIYSLDDYYKLLLAGEAQLWAVMDDGIINGAAITSLDFGSAGGACTVHKLGGRGLKNWYREFDEEITRFAKANGCSAVMAVTRKGFTKYFPDFEEDGVIYVRVIK